MIHPFKQGFTLIELLIVMAILGILVTVGASNFQSARLKAKDVQRKSDLQTIAKSLEAYVNDYGKYPNENNGQIVCQTSPSSVVCPWGSAFTDGKTLYAAKLPQESGGGRQYRYTSIGNGTSYRLYASLENTEDPAIDTSITGVTCGTKACNYMIKSSNLTN